MHSHPLLTVGTPLTIFNKVKIWTYTLQCLPNDFRKVFQYRQPKLKTLE